MSPSADTVVPLIAVEEHHEAFYIWHHAIAQGWMPAEGNALVHVDEHSDLSLPRLRRPLGSWTGLHDIAKFTYDELDIGNFIWPAVYEGIFSSVLWVRSVHADTGMRRMTICARDESRCEFITGRDLSATKWATAPDQRHASVGKITVHDPPPALSSWVLDIDLDYFCCNSFPDQRGNRIEITRGAYEDFHADPHHFLRISPGSKVSAVEENGRYFLTFNDYPNGPVPEFDASVISARIAGFRQWLGSIASAPSLIVICRSVRSGYTPASVAENLCDLLHETLQNLYSVHSHRDNSVLPALSGNAPMEASLP